MAPTLDRPEAARGFEMTGIGASPLVVFGTTEDVRAGSVLIKSNVCLPESLHFESKRYGSWKLLTEWNGSAVEGELSETGWHFFFMVPGIRVSALSSDRNKALRKGLKKALATTESQNFNALEIVEITTKRFLGLYCVRVVAHPRHVKGSPFLRDLDPYHTTRNVWDSKQVLRRHAQIGSTAKGI
jgi:hypothetical protein